MRLIFSLLFVLLLGFPSHSQTILDGLKNSRFRDRTTAREEGKQQHQHEEEAVVVVTAGGESGPVWKNWEGTVTCFPRELANPTTVEEVSSLVSSHGRVRAIGLGHSYNDFACSDDLMISTAKLDKVLSIDEAKRTVTVQSGLRTRKLIEHLAAHGYTLETFPFFIDQSIGGAVINGAHGSSTRIGSLSMLLRAVKVVAADGTVRVITQGDGDIMEAARVSVGLLGVLVELTLAIVPDELVERDLHILRQENVATDLQRALKDPLSVDELQWWFFPKIRMVTRSSIHRLSAPDHKEGHHPLLQHHHHKKDQQQPPPPPTANATSDLRIGKLLSRFYMNRLKDRPMGARFLNFTARYMKSPDKHIASTFLLVYHAGVNLQPGKFHFSEALPSQMESVTDGLYKVYGSYDQYEFAIPFTHMLPCWTSFLDLLHHDATMTDDFLVAMCVRFLREESAFLSMSYGGPRLFINIDNYDVHDKGGGWSRSFQSIKDLMHSDICQARLYHFGKATWSSGRGGLWSSGDMEQTKASVGYQAWDRFMAVVKQMDPQGKFGDHRGLLRSTAHY